MTRAIPPMMAEVPRGLVFFYLAPILSFRFSEQSIFLLRFIGELHFGTELVLLPSVVEFYDIYFNQC
jgi:hypothetical protein